MPTYQSGRERQEIPFRSGGFQYIKRIYPHSIENNGKLVHKGYIHVTLGILDNLGGFGYLDTRRTVQPRLNDQLIDFRYRFQSFGIAAGNDLHGIYQGMYLITRIDSFRWVSNLKVLSYSQPWNLLQDRDAILFRTSRIYGRFVYYIIASFKDFAYRAGRTQQRG